MATMQDHGGCLDSMTEILTARGWVGPREIRDDDTVAGYDRFCGAIRWCKILHRHERVIDPWEAMFAAKGRCLDLRVTGNHRILTSERDTVGGSKMWRGHYEFMRADALSASTKRVKIPVAGTQDAPGVHLTDDQLRFLGWWITDGTMSGKRQQVSITQADHQPHIAELRECLFANGFHVREVRRTDTGGFIGSRPQTEFQIPKGTCKSRPRKGWWELRHYMEKTLASPLDTMTARQFDIFLHAIHLGDGDKAKGDGAYRISTGNKVFADRLQSLAVRRGWKCNIATGEGGERLNPIYVLNMQKLTAMTLHGANVATADNQLRLVPSPSIVGFTTVWCVANEMDTLVIRRNGMVAIVGNSWHRHGSLNEDRSWSLDCTASSVVGMREERLRRREEREPTRCPQCAKIVTSAVCVCGHVIRQRSRPVVQTDGTFKELVGTIYAPRRISQAANAKSVWKQCYYAAKNSKKGMTFKQAMAWFSQRMNYGWPDTSWPMMPQKTADLFRNVADVPYEDLIHG